MQDITTVANPQKYVLSLLKDNPLPPELVELLTNVANTENVIRHVITMMTVLNTEQVKISGWEGMLSGEKQTQEIESLLCHPQLVNFVQLVMAITYISTEQEMRKAEEGH
jgi:hypothetical protein